MAYRFQLDESFRDGFVRIGLEQIERAAQRLRAPEDRVVAIHETRKGLKRIRALLRLARPGLGEGVFRRENARFRDIAALLSGVRDRQVLAQTLMKLERRPEPKAAAIVGAFRSVLGDEKAVEAIPFDEGAVKKAVAALDTAYRSFKKLKLSRPGMAVVGQGLEDCYRRGRKAFAAAYENPSDEAFHEWRKAVQQHWRHMALLTRAWPEVMEARVAEAKKLSELLGDDHDLAVLAALAQAKAKEGMNGALARDLERLCRKGQRDLRAAARPYGRRLYADSPKDLRARIALYWEAARGMDEEATPEAKPTPDVKRRAAPRMPARRGVKGAGRT